MANREERGVSVKHLCSIKLLKCGLWLKSSNGDDQKQALVSTTLDTRALLTAAGSCLRKYYEDT